MIEDSHRRADRSLCIRSHQDSAADEVLSSRRPPARARRRLLRFMASSPKVTPQKDKVPENGESETPPDSPLLTEEASEEGEEAREEADEEAESEGGELVEVQQKVPAKTEAKETAERTDDPVRMYLREMGSVELLSREGEIAIAKRIEAGREAMIAGLCESPLTFQAIIIWRDELNEGKVFLRDIIDLEATYAEHDALAGPGAQIQEAQGRDHHGGEVVAPQPGAHRFTRRAAL